MIYQLRFNIEISFQLTNEQFKILTAEIKKNSQIAGNADQGGFWYGNINRRNFLKTKKEKETCWHTATTRQMDTVILKALEMCHYTKSTVMQELYADLYTVLKNAVDFSNSLTIHSGTVEVKNGRTKLN